MSDPPTLKKILIKDMFIDFKEGMKKGGKEKEGEREPLICCFLTRNRTHNLGMCHDRGIKPRPFWFMRLHFNQLSPTFIELEEIEEQAL